MGREEDDSNIVASNKKERRCIRLIKRNIRKKQLIILLLVLSTCLLITTNIKTNYYYNKVQSELEIIKSKYLEQVRRNHELKAKMDLLVKTSNEVETQKAKAEELDEVNEKLNEVLKENEKLKRYNQELIEDNISLQNSLKLAAMVGIKPQNYRRPPIITFRSGVDRSRYLGRFKITAYTPSPSECGNNKGLTASGHPIIPGMSVAVDKKYWPLGTIFYIKGIGYVIAMDTGGKVKGRNRFDLAVFDKKFAYAIGCRYWDVYLIKMGRGKVDTSFFSK